ncbi:MAG: DUF1819 family protein [Sporolactobacillus sp.]|nr:DUF1819 family protein [Sporolactobacillus sp.]
MTGQDYASTLKSFPLLLLELKTVCRLHLQGLDKVALKKKIVDDNLFQSVSVSRRKELASVVLRRQRHLDDFLMKKLLSADLGTARVIALYAAAKEDRLLREFIAEMIGDKLVAKSNSLTRWDIEQFFESKRQQSKRIRYWQADTLIRLREAITHILREAGFLIAEPNGDQLRQPIIDPDVAHHLRRQELKPWMWVGE